MKGKKEQERIVELETEKRKSQRSEKEIQEARRLAEYIVETVRHPLLVLDTTLRILYANPDFYRVFQVDPEKTNGRLIYELGDNQWDIPKLRQLLEEVLPNHNPFQNFEVEHEFSSVGFRTMLLNARRLDHVQMILLAIEDITERKHAEKELARYGEHLEELVRERTTELEDSNEKLRGEVSDRKKAEKALAESEARYRTIFENTGSATVILEEDATISLANAEYAKLSGYSREEVEGRMSWTDFVHADDLAGMMEYHRMRRVDPATAPNDYEFRYVNRAGGIRDVYVYLKMIPGTKNSVASLLDLTEQKQMRGSLEKLAQCFLGLGTEPFTNIERILGCGGEILGGTFIAYSRMQKETLSILSTIEGEKGFQVAVDPSQYLSYEVIKAAGPASIALDLDGSAYKESDPLVRRYRIRSFLGHPIRGEGLAGCIGLYDTHKRSFIPAETHILGMLARAITIEEERLARERNLKEFIDIAAHELRHPITIMQGYANLLRESEDELDRGTKQHALEAIGEGADRLNKLSIELLDGSRIARGQFLIERQEITLEPLIERAVGEMQRKGYGSELRVSVSEEIGAINADPVKLAMLLSILLDNAATYSPEGSEIDIRAERKDGEVVVSVLDRGPGIPEEARLQVFERFSQVDDALHHSMPGIGLGLYIAREIAVNHGGRIWYEPRESGGSIFAFALPE